MDRLQNMINVFELDAKPDAVLSATKVSNGHHSSVMGIIWLSFLRQHDLDLLTFEWYHKLICYGQRVQHIIFKQINWHISTFCVISVLYCKPRWQVAAKLTFDLMLLALHVLLTATKAEA